MSWSLNASLEKPGILLFGQCLRLCGLLINLIKYFSRKYSVGLCGTLRSGPIVEAPLLLSVWQAKQFFINT